MFAITGITGRVGSATASALLAAHESIRAIVRNPAKAVEWEKRGAEIAIADSNDAAALTRAFSGVEGVFVMIPPYFDPSPGFPEARAILAALRTALLAANVPKFVCLSSIGAHRASGLGLITQLAMLEQELGSLAIPHAFVRAGWFMENHAWDLAPAQTTGRIPSFLAPLDLEVPMIATQDIGEKSAELLQQNWTGRRIVELEGPRPYSPNDIAAAFAKVIGRPVVPEVVPRESWEAIFRSQSAANPLPRMEMLDGFNFGWIRFEGAPAEHATGPTALETVIADLVSKGGSGQ